MKYRKLRIAWSVAWGVACLLLVALWVRSYWWGDKINGVLFQGAPLSALMSNDGEIHLAVIQGLGNFPSGWEVASLELAKHRDEFPQFNNTLGFAFEKIPNFFLLSVPDWFAILLSGAIAAAPWLRWRFSLRTLLIVMTVAAIGLGWIVYSLRK